MEDNSLIQKNPFGFNITLPKRTIQEVKKVVQQEIENIAVNPVNDFLESADSVFSGQTAKEIRIPGTNLFTRTDYERRSSSIYVQCENISTYYVQKWSLLYCLQFLKAFFYE